MSWERAAELGITPDVIRAQNRLYHSKIWDEADASDQAKINADIEKAYQVDKPNLEEVINNAIEQLENIARIKKQPIDSPIFEALKRAQSKKQ
jgi:hypothetical protein